MSQDDMKTKLEVLENFLASIAIAKTNSIGNWCGTSHILNIRGVKFSVHFEQYNKHSNQKLYFNGFHGSYCENEEFEEYFGRQIPTGYICLEALKNLFPEARITCGHSTCKVHRDKGTDEIDLIETLVGEVPALKQQVFPRTNF